MLGNTAMITLENTSFDGTMAFPENCKEYFE
jgi:hypothetical protein